MMCWGVGDPDQPTPQHIIDALTKAANDPADRRYPTGEEGDARFPEGGCGLARPATSA